MTIKAPVKNYRLRKLSKTIKRIIFSEALQVYLLARKWDKKDLSPINSQNNEIVSHEGSLFSQNGEDGIIRKIFSEIGFSNKYLVEFGFGAHQCNSLRLILYENFKGLLMDGSIEQCRLFNLACKKRRIDGVKAINVFLNKDNLESIIKQNNIPSEIDFLSIDVDGNDLWLWKCLNCIKPRVVCIEYNAGIGPEKSWSSPYSDNFERFASHPSGFFAGASITALESLGSKKGYRLVGCDSTGTNAFFLRGDLAQEKIPTVSARKAFKPHLNWLGRGISERQQLEIMQSFPYIEV